MHIVQVDKSSSEVEFRSFSHSISLVFLADNGHDFGLFVPLVKLPFGYMVLVHLHTVGALDGELCRKNELESDVALNP